MTLLITLHNVGSSQRCQEFVQIASGLGFKNLAITKASGSAASRGIPQAQKIAVKSNANFMFLGNISDVIEVYNPDEIILVAPPPFGDDLWNPEEVKKESEEKRLLLIFGGSSPGLSRRELDMGKAVNLDVPIEVGSIGTLAIALYELKKVLKE
ncbi:MAG: hypothetical protein KAR35_02730 [Candidatus Heimdallarchaeota archaeon]|nr:hypothetical protein [Candidatus Heimdallarchaeota archaeon]MCK5048270.1 hypothetical protein [Candidatus Heimdallarchaeota archaeon]